MSKWSVSWLEKVGANWPRKEQFFATEAAAGLKVRELKSRPDAEVQQIKGPYEQ